jgi:hypothetical protein
MRLHDEHVATANTFSKTRTYFTICEFDNVCFTKLHFQMLCHFFGKLWVSAPCVESHSLCGDFVDRFVHLSSGGEPFGTA